MKDLRKVLWLLTVGLFTAGLLYPFMHELGHSVAAILFCGRVREFHLFPLPNILCDGTAVTNSGLAAIGICGTVIPFLISISYEPKRFTLWYIFQLIKGISSLGFVLSLMSLVGQKFGFTIENDDIVTVLKFWSGGRELCIVMIIALLVVSVYSICRQQPIKRLYKYFEIE